MYERKAVIFFSCLIMVLVIAACSNTSRPVNELRHYPLDSMADAVTRHNYLFDGPLQ